jgi:putative transposase
MQKHFAKRINRCLLHSQTTQEILERLDTSYQRFFKHLAKRPPKFRKAKDFNSFLFKQGGYSLNGNVLTINNIGKRFKFSLSRPYEGKVKTLTVKRSHIGEFYIVMVLDKAPVAIRKSHNGASVGIDFGLRKYLTISDGQTVDNPQFLKSGLRQLQRKSRNLSKCVPGSHNRERKRLELNRLHEKVVNRRGDFQWKLSHQLCRQYDTIFLEDLSLVPMFSTYRWGRKMSDLAHGEFVQKLQYVATKYGVIVHKIDRDFPSSQTCTCGHIYKDLRLQDYVWTCPQCGVVHDRDRLAAGNIIRQGIAELESARKTPPPEKAKVQTRLHPRISRLQA